MSPRALTLVTALAIWPSTPLAGQEALADPLTLSRAVRRALEHDPAVRGAVAGSDAARASVGEARAPRFPTLALTGSATRFQEPMVAIPIHGFEPGNLPPFDQTLFQAGLTLQYTLFDGGARGARVRGARARADAAGAALDEAARQLVARVVRTYLAAQSAREVVDAHDRRIAALAAELARVRQRREVGRAADIEVLRVEASAAAAQADRVRAAAELELAELELARLTDLAPADTRADRLAAVGDRDTTLPAREVLTARALVASPALERARGELAAARAARALAAGARWPTLELVGAYVDRGGLDTDHSLEWNVGVQLSYPVFTGGAVGGAVARAEAEARAAAERVRAAEQQVGRDVDRAVATVEESRARAASLETAVSRFAEVARIELLRQETGTGTQTDYLAAEADLLAARAALADARRAVIVARAELARVTGTLDLAWVDQRVEVER